MPEPLILQKFYWNLFFFLLLHKLLKSGLPNWCPALSSPQCDAVYHWCSLGGGEGSRHGGVHIAGPTWYATPSITKVEQFWFRCSTALYVQRAYLHEFDFLGTTVMNRAITICLGLFFFKYIKKKICLD